MLLVVVVTLQLLLLLLLVMVVVVLMPILLLLLLPLAGLIVFVGLLISIVVFFVIFFFVLLVICVTIGTRGGSSCCRGSRPLYCGQRERHLLEPTLAVCNQRKYESGSLWRTACGVSQHRSLGLPTQALGICGCPFSHFHPQSFVQLQHRAW